MLKSNSVNVHCKFGARQKWEPTGRIGDFGNCFNVFAKSLRLILLNIDWMQFVLKNCATDCKSKVCMINSTVSPQMWCIKSISRLVYTPPDLLSRFCKVNLSKAKNSAWFVFQEFVFQALNLLWSRAIMALKCDRRLLLFLGCTYKAINSM